MPAPNHAVVPPARGWQWEGGGGGDGAGGGLRVLSSISRGVNGPLWPQQGQREGVRDGGCRLSTQRGRPTTPLAMGLSPSACCPFYQTSLPLVLQAAPPFLRPCAGGSEGTVRMGTMGEWELCPWGAPIASQQEGG